MRTIGEIILVNDKTVTVNVPVYGLVECITDDSENVYKTVSEMLESGERRPYGVIEILECEAYFIRFLDRKDVQAAVKNNDSMNICDFCNRTCITNKNCLFEWNGLFDAEEGIKGYC
jgi:hypothetical protein